MEIPRNSTNLRLLVFIENDGIPVTGIEFDTIDFGIKVFKQNASSFTTVTLVEGTLGTFLSNSWKEMGEGWYQFCPDNSFIVPGRFTIIQATQTDGTSSSGMLCAVGSTADTPTDATIKFQFGIPGAEATLTPPSSTVYIKEKGLIVELTANINIEAIPLVVIFENSDTTDKLVIEDGDLTKSGTSVTFTLPDAFVDDLGSYKYAVRNATTLRVYGQSSITVSYAPYEDA